MLTDGRTTDDGVIGILIAHLGAFGSGELKKSGALGEFSITSLFFGSKCKNQIFEENKGFECSFLELKYR